MPRPLTTLLAIASLALPAVTGAALRHLGLKRAEPASGATVGTPPAVLRLWFTQRSELAVTSVRLRTRAGTPVGIGRLTRADSANAPIVAPITQPLAAGAYTVEWRTMARDGHPVRGSYAFTVRAR